VCGNPARTDLCGGRPVMGVPTANPEPAPYCPADWCDVLDGVGMTPEAFKRSRAPDGAKVLACALRRNRY